MSSTMEELKQDIASIRYHLDKIKQRQNEEDKSRIEQNKKLDLLVHTLTDNDFNSNNGLIKRFIGIEKMVIIHDLYWRIVIALMIPIYAGAIAIIYKLYVK